MSRRGARSLLFATAVSLFAVSGALAQSAAPLLEKGQELLGKGDYTTAAELLREGLKIDPNNQRGLYWLAEALAKLQATDAELLEMYRKSYELDRTSKLGVEALVKIKQLEQRVAK